MSRLPVLRLPAPVRGWPRRSRSRPRARAAITVAALSALALTGLASTGPAARAAAEGPYGGTAAAVPGTVYAENYDTGGQGVAYNVTSVNGTDNAYRSDGVDLETTTDTGGPANDLGWTAATQWFKYTVNVATAGTYTVGLRLAAPAAVTDGLHIDNSAGTNLSGSVNVPATGGWQTWTTVIATVTLPAGTQTLTVDQDNGGWNINFLAFGAG
jgi:beta-glucosidase